LFRFASAFALANVFVLPLLLLLMLPPPVLAIVSTY
jgi:hypothetical protein